MLTVHERTSRLLLGIRLASKVARGVARHLVGFFATLPQELRQSVTFDNGTEFARSPGAAPPLDRDLLLRSPCPLAEGWHRERHRQDAPLYSPQDGSRNPLDRQIPPVHRRLQQHPAQMP
ncbi:hypothetical protein J6525_44570 [Bradyrhizobium sp. WSM 4400]|uniref:hypothetical protein n=1 Tax=Bradyrhizobium australafricanum TaxID=2821406 RepID=UPI001CE35A42|nr:hypothetical protein [Bradyrhizobium australafricanum]MCA6105328.1 hypothetical protein [Bradyrhizobium australafricanum]